MLRCPGCEKTKPDNQFYPNRARKSGRDTYCKDCKRAQGRAYGRTRNEWKNQRRRDLRRQVMEKYGGECVCCGETEEAFLVLDHVNGGGTKERKSTGSMTLHLRLIREPVNPEYQILCANCNTAKERAGGCPHWLLKEGTK